MGRGWKRARNLSTAPVPHPTAGPSVPAADPTDAQPAFEDAGDGRKGIVAGHRWLQLGAQRTDGGGPTGESGAPTVELLPCPGSGHDRLAPSGYYHRCGGVGVGIPAGVAV